MRPPRARGPYAGRSRSAHEQLRHARPLRVLVAPTAFRGSLTPAQAADAMRTGVVAADARILVRSLPAADGGDGTLAVVATHTGADCHELEVADALGRPRRARFALYEQPRGRTAFIEMAEASGLRHIADSERDVLRSSTFGVGVLIRGAIEAGAQTIVVGAGGSAAIDGGAGALAALGARFLDERGDTLQPIPSALSRTNAIDTSALARLFSGVHIVVASDVRLPLRNNAAAFGTQKGLRAADGPVVAGMIDALERCGRANGRPFADVAWCGAGGGLAGGLYSFAGAQVLPGAEFVLDLIRFDRHLAKADLVLTGEGRYDATSVAGKLTGAVAERAAALGIPAAIIAGTIDLPGVDLPGNASLFAIARGSAGLQGMLRGAPSLVACASKSVARLFLVARDSNRPAALRHLQHPTFESPEDLS